MFDPTTCIVLIKKKKKDWQTDKIGSNLQEVTRCHNSDPDERQDCCVWTAELHIAVSIQSFFFSAHIRNNVFGCVLG